MGFGTTITLGALTIGGTDNVVDKVSKQKVDGTLKSRINDRWQLTPIPNRAKEWEINISGKLTGTNKDTDRTELESYDDGDVRLYEDGFLSINVIVIKLTFPNDGARSWNKYEYDMTLREYTQSV